MLELLQYIFLCNMPKEKEIFRELMRVFVSGSMYILMFVVAIFIFYKTIVLFFFVFAAIFVHISEF